ncbi:hypothetical protein H8A95_18640 [Bradyrhizobium sp. Pear76]|uniref:carbohydrate porin n=1 Tax=Bradyrhizobium oropedii TaxID=1571201 RepID=UPI001E647827|nr:carbohydrate porin [Bradyrhizobium oropedii]MCC8964283.1 hypothetical protein [Bradyrhizobium oropedii]
MRKVESQEKIVAGCVNASASPIRYGSRIGRSVACLASATLLVACSAHAWAKDADEAHTANATHHSKAKPTKGNAPKLKLPREDRPAELKGAPAYVTTPAIPYFAPDASAADINKRLGYHGYITPFPTFADSVLGNDQGWRSALANQGFGILMSNREVMYSNLLNTPKSVPSTFPACGPNDARRGSMCAGNQIYTGQSPFWLSESTATLTYDTGRWGVPDGLIAVAGTWNATNYERGLTPNTFRMSLLSWYQTAFVRKMEIELGYLRLAYEFMGTTVGGSYAAVFGPTAALTGIMGLGNSQEAAPAARFTWHFDDHFYNQFAVQRSMPVNDQYPVYISEQLNNPTGFDFTSPVRGTRAVFVNEFGYRQEAVPGTLRTWLRVGGMYNNSAFRDLSKPGATTDGYGLYALGDWQLWQQDPSSPGTAYRGIYVGGTYTYVPEKVSAFSQYFEGRVYWMGPTAARARDMFSVVYTHNDISKYFANPINAASYVSGISAANWVNSVTASYTARLSAGTYLTAGLSYVDRPSIAYFQKEGSALLFQGALLVYF